MALAPVGQASLNQQYVTIGNGAMDWNITSASSISFTNSSGGFPNIFGGAYGNASDRRFKQNITPLTNGLALAMQLKPSTYEMIDTGLPTIGFIAQDVQEVLPSLVTTVKFAPPEGDSEDRLSLNYNGIIPVLVHAIQELSATVSALQAQVQVHASVLPAAATPAVSTAETANP